MPFDDRPGDRETEAGTFTGWFRGKKWVEDHFDGIGRYTWPVISESGCDKSIISFAHGFDV